MIQNYTSQKYITVERFRISVHGLTPAPTYGATDTHKQSYTSAKSIFFEINAEFIKLEKQIDGVKNGLKKIEAPVIKSY